MLLSPDFRAVRLAEVSDHDTLDRKVISAALEARKEISCDKAIFGDCLDVSRRTVAILNKAGIPAKLTGGQFVTNPVEDEEWDHSWVIVDGEILDPTVDQFFSPLDVDLETTVPGIYYSPVDGGWLDDRYKR
jgi:transglutaminase-like putative cysteine protease